MEKICRDILLFSQDITELAFSYNKSEKIKSITEEFPHKEYAHLIKVIADLIAENEDGYVIDNHVVYLLPILQEKILKIVVDELGIFSTSGG